MRREKQKVALVTGGNRGIGLATVHGLAQRGIKVLLGCRDLASGAQAAEGLEGDVNVVALNLSDSAELQRQVATIEAEYPQIDILVNNAAVLEEGDFASVEFQHLMSSMQVNAMAAMQLTQHFGNAMARRGYGRIVNLSSGWGAFSDGLTGPAAYSISKAALNAVTKVAANSYPTNVKVNALCPGWVRTRMGGEMATRSAEQGAQTAIWLALLDDDGPSGQFFRDKEVIDW
ncbi:SDR family NAD(P)-dependent oxidoreductase [Ferrimonas sp. YFM]|uniref:SDR family NAD(P)-dependent oxidoreductase n=1 Tax=Ferrimonas sp. YFM TaxID=3028878 RepID=UPI002573A6F3|nr:SDR family NAD(P)-dependent oxidoreductase [Ferrimonas sp. YFM]BDY04446.1 20-beta-hydroxysteroid dehydrogenase [Ferrimonas sp. YFM]